MRTKFILFILCLSALPVVAQVVEFKQYITPFDTAHNYYGRALDFQGSTFVVGNPDNDTDEYGISNMDNAGAVYIYSFGATNWNFEEKLVPSDRDIGDRFGKSVDIQGEEMIIGADRVDEVIGPSNSILNVGAVYYYALQAGIWIQKQRFMSSDRITGDGFGEFIFRKESELFIHASGQDYNSQGQNYIMQAGAVYYFKLESGAWTEKQKIVAHDRTDEFEFFGKSIYSDATHLFIGGGNGSDENGSNYIAYSGAVFVYEKDLNDQWVFLQKLKASDAQVNDGFGQVGISVSGNQLIIGSGNDYDVSGNNLIDNAGAVYVFERNLQGEWIEIQKLVSQHRQQDALFGFSLSFEPTLIAIGAPEDKTDANNLNSFNTEGAIYLYELSDNGLWEFWKKVVANNRIGGSKFGTQVSLVNNNLIVTSIGDKAGTQFTIGSAHYFTISSGGTGISKISSQITVQVYPNPFINEISIKSSSEIIRIRIFDLQGKVVHESPLNVSSRKHSVLIGKLPASIYIIQVHTLDGVHSERLVKIE